jgi:catechol 2,3-dioxygenase-like lactoylglutathione lyase family enzyme
MPRGGDTGICSLAARPGRAYSGADPETKEMRMNWSIHHVNLAATDVRKTAKFYAAILGMQETAWVFPPADQTGAIPNDPARLTLFPDHGAGDPQNRGLHLIQPDPTFARRNNLDHNPSIGGHVAINVPDLDAVMARLREAGVPYSYTPTYAIEGMRHIYVYDPSMNLLEINEVIG